MSKADVHPARRSTDRICTQLAELSRIAADERALGAREPSVSSWSVGEQLEHLRRSDETILAALDQIESSKEEGVPNFIGRLVLLSGFIPRGRGRAPKATQPLRVDPETLAAELDGLRERFELLRTRLPALVAVPGKIKHPALGRFSAAQMLAFTHIHHHHHRKIIRDIRRAIEREERR